MKISCDVIKDVLPLYVEDLASADTRTLVEEHLSSCNNCKRKYEKLRTPDNFTTDMNMLPLNKLKKTLNKRKYRISLFSITITFVLLVILIGYLTSPIYIPAEKVPVTIEEQTNNTIILNFNTNVTGYDIEKRSTDDGVYFITAWDNIWNRIISKETKTSIVLNPNGEKVYSIYYSSNNGDEDLLIYGKHPYPSGGVITLPRLALAYYLKLAILLAIVTGVFLFIFHKNKKLRNIFTKIFAFPIAYILGHLCTKGLTTQSYSLVHDFFMIVLAMIPIYAALLLEIRFLSRKR
ncbi:anti-sigma factor family protein [Anaerosporobacter sp.]